MAIEIGRDVIIEDGAIIDVKSGKIGDRTIIRSGAVIRGTHVEIGTESYLDHSALIGGGSCFEDSSSLIAGDWLHMGWNSQINIARPVKLGNEVGIGIETKIFTHGAYLPFDMGFPVQWGPVTIGSRVWLPNAWVNPLTVIGDNVVVAARSLVNRDLPSGCLAAGTPVEILKRNYYPKTSDVYSFSAIQKDIAKMGGSMPDDASIITIDSRTHFDLKRRIIEGHANDMTHKIKEYLRRNGVRFRYIAKNGEYVPWEAYYE